VAAYEVSWTCRRGVGDRGAPSLAAHRPGQAQFGHQPLDGAAGHRDALAVERQPHLARAIDPEVRGVDPPDVLFEFLIADLAATGLMVDLVIIGRGGNLDAEFDERGAD